jgi:hypothetical protein
MPNVVGIARASWPWPRLGGEGGVPAFRFEGSARRLSFPAPAGKDSVGDRVRSTSSRLGLRAPARPSRWSAPGSYMLSTLTRSLKRRLGNSTSLRRGSLTSTIPWPNDSYRSLFVLRTSTHLAETKARLGARPTPRKIGRRTPLSLTHNGWPCRRGGRGRDKWQSPGRRSALRIAVLNVVREVSVPARVSCAPSAVITVRRRKELPVAAPAAITEGA